jgi:hypothetical protein
MESVFKLVRGVLLFGKFERNSISILKKTMILLKVACIGARKSSLKLFYKIKGLDFNE